MGAGASAGRFPGMGAARWPRRLNMPHLDAAENAFFLRELEHISPKLYEKKYAELKGRQMVPTENEGMSPGDQSFTYRMWDFKGMAQAISDFADDLLAVNEHGEEQTQRLQAYGVSYNYSQEEIAAAAKLNRPLEADRAHVAKKVADQKIDSICAIGDPAYSLNGILTLANTTTFAPAVKAAGGTAWIDVSLNLVATPDEVLADMNGAVRTVISNTLDVEHPRRLVLPVAQYQAISTRARSAVSDTTILKFFELNNPTIEVLSWERLKNGAYNPASPAVTPTTDRMLVYDPDVTKVKLLMALEFVQLPPQARNLAYVVNCWEKTGGVISPYPKSICYTDGI